jgi:hypothetical protein
VTTLFDENGQIVQWYIDICHTYGVSEDNVLKKAPRRHNVGLSLQDSPNGIGYLAGIK